MTIDKFIEIDKKNITRKKGEITHTWWKRTVKEAFKHDPLRILIELIKNSADSYTKLKNNKGVKPPFEILMELGCQQYSPPLISVKDTAEGINSRDLEKSLAYGTETSLEDKEAVTSAEKGIGLKDAMMAMEKNLILTVKNGKLNTRNKFTNFDTGEILVDHLLTPKEKGELGIKENGTIVRGILPDYFKERSFEKICQKLSDHFLMRKLVQNEEFSIICVDKNTGEEINLKKIYKSPKIDSSFKPIVKKIEISYGGENYEFLLEIKKSKNPLQLGKPFGKAGLIFYYGGYTVADFSFGKQTYPEMCYFFGEVKMGVEKLVRAGEMIVDEKRKGLSSDFPLNDALLEKVNEIVKEVADSQRKIVQYDFTKEDWMQKEMQKIYRDISGPGKKIFNLPLTPKKFEFAPAHTTIFEYEEKNIFLIINTTIISSDTEISLECSDCLKIVSPANSKIIIKEEEKEENSVEKNGETFIVKTIRVYSDKKGEDGEILAGLNGYHTSKIGVEVLENPIFNPKDGFQFDPNVGGKINIVEENSKKINLIIDESLYDEKDREVKIENTNESLDCAGKFELPIDKNLKKYQIKNVIKYPFEIKVKSGEVENRKGKIKAFYKNKETELKIRIIPPSGGINFKGIKFDSQEKIKDISRYDDNGYIYIYQNHPLVKKYMLRNWKSKRDFLVFASDVVTKEFIEKTVRDSIDLGHSKFEIMNIDNPDPEIRMHVINEYHKLGVKCHEIIIQYLKSGILNEK